MLTLTDLRKSVRNFTDKPIDENKLQEITDYFKKCRRIDKSIKTEIMIIKKSGLPKDIKEIGGYNGFLIEAPYYILIFSEKKPYFIENVGYIGEDILLKLTDMDIDSCWMTLKEEKVVEEGDKMRITGLIALGYGERIKKISKLKNMFISKYGNGDLEAPKPGTDNEIRMDILDMVFMGDYGKTASYDELTATGLSEGFYAARRAPSALNRQPWRFILDGGTVALVIKKDEYTNIYEAQIAAGAAMLNFAVVISERIFDVKWEMGAADFKYNIPDDSFIIAHCRV
ncbi:nitroreductase [Anaerotignum faecicola]|nr:nitroreductase [Anaerotignum faecicola]